MSTSINLESLYRKVIDIAKQQYSISKHDLDVDLYRVEDLYNSGIEITVDKMKVISQPWVEANFALLHKEFISKNQKCT